MPPQALATIRKKDNLPADCFRETSWRLRRGVEHWHGAVPDSWFAHIAITTNPQENATVWLSTVSNKQYEEAVNGAETRYSEANRVLAEREQAIVAVASYTGKGDLENKIRDDIKLYGLENEVLLLGVRSDIPDLLHVMDVLLMPSLFEGNPVSLIEAQAAALPCVISDIITDKIDMELNLISKVSLSSPVEKWIEAIIKASRTAKPSKGQIVMSLHNKGYDINETTKLLTDIYLGRQ